MALVTNATNDLNKLEEDINKLLESFPKVCPAHLKGGESSRFGISGEVLTSMEFLQRWEAYLQRKQNKQKTSNDSNNSKNENKPAEIPPSKRGRGRPKKELSQTKQIEEPSENISEYAQQLEQLLEDHIQQDILMRNALLEELEEEEVNEINSNNDNAHEDEIINNYDDDDEVQKKYLLATPSYAENDSTHKTSIPLQQQILQEGYEIHEVKGDGVFFLFFFFFSCSFFFTIIFSFLFFFLFLLYFPSSHRTVFFVPLRILFFTTKVSIRKLDK
jgi:hypothetical protein